MSDTRNAGRFVRRDEVGRTRVLERTRAALRERPTLDIQRKEIANLARVTPALISYYFPDRSSLFFAAAQPIIDDYVDSLREILNSTDSILSKLRAVAYLFVSFNYHDGYLLSFYIDHAAKDKDSTALEKLNFCQAELNRFFDELLSMQLLRGECPYTLQSILWGMCKNLAEQLRDQRFLISDELLVAKAEAIIDCFLNGAAGLNLIQQIAKAA